MGKKRKTRMGRTRAVELYNLVNAVGVIHNLQDRYHKLRGEVVPRGVLPADMVETRAEALAVLKKHAAVERKRRAARKAAKTKLKR